MLMMSRYPDKYFDLAVVDPPYGIGEDGEKNHSRGSLAKPKMYTPVRSLLSVRDLEAEFINYK